MGVLCTGKQAAACCTSDHHTCVALEAAAPFPAAAFFPASGMPFALLAQQRCSLSGSLPGGVRVQLNHGVIAGPGAAACVSRYRTREASGNKDATDTGAAVPH